jgi:hypothetical protein
MMAAYYVLEPEVAGGWGKNTVFTRTAGRPVVVHRLHYEFDGWLGDELVESTPCYLVTKRLSDEIARAQLTGAVFDEVEVTTSDEFKELHPDRVLPNWLWLKADGVPGVDDFTIGLGSRLIVSEALALLKRVGIPNAGSITPFR